MINDNAVDKNVAPKLSICMATYNRGAFIGETLESILNQLAEGVELVVVDGASPDNTPEVMAQYLLRYPEIRYFREQVNSGVDCDFDKAVGYAKGEYCWLMTDDDLLRRGAVKKVLSVIEEKCDLVVVNAEVKNADLSETMEGRRLNIFSDIEYGIENREAFFKDAASYLSFIGCVVIKKDFWQSRDRSSYYGSLFIHVGVIFQHPPIEHVRVIADPLIVIRYGNAMWTARGFEVWMFKWPRLIWSFSDYSDSAKRTICRCEPWKSAKALFHHRAIGSYTVAEFHRFWPSTVGVLDRIVAYAISVFSAKLANLIMVFYFGLRAKTSGMALYDLLHSRNATGASRLLARVMGVKDIN